LIAGNESVAVDHEPPLHKRFQQLNIDIHLRRV